MIDRDPVIRDAFEDDASRMSPAHQDRLWSEMLHRQTRQIRRRYIARAGVVLVAGAAVGGFIALRSVSRSSAPDAEVIAADSLPNFSPSEPTVIQEPAHAPVSNLIPLLGHRSSLQMDISRYEDQIDALSRRLNQTSGQEREVLSRQLREFEDQLQGTKKAMALVDRELSGHQGPVQTYSNVIVPPEAPIIFGGPSGQDVMFRTTVLGGGLLLICLALLVYMRRIARTTRDALAQVESQISSQHATLASGIDAIALEVERLGEGQRFMSRVLSKGEPQPREATT